MSGAGTTMAAGVVPGAGVPDPLGTIAGRGRRWAGGAVARADAFTERERER